MKILIVIDMQNDFVTDALCNIQAQNIVDKVVDKVKNWQGKVIFTRDTHQPNYMDTIEGKYLPVPHCIEGSNGWQIIPPLAPYAIHIIDKPTFGSIELCNALTSINSTTPIESITLIGVCTDICVISNAMLAKATLPNTPIIVDSSCCAGVTVDSHHNALNAMKMCHIEVL